MIDQERIRALMANKVGSVPVPKEVSSTLDLSGLSVSQLSELRDEVTALLPDTRQMDLHKELATQYVLVKQYQAEVLSNTEIPANQVAQCLNTTVATLGHLIKLQESLEREEQLKKMEGCFFEAIKTLPDETKDLFFEEYALIAHREGLS